MLPTDDITADQDIELDVDSPDEIVAEPDVEAAIPADLDPVLEKELQAALVEDEEETPIRKPMIPTSLIERELTPDDLFDDGSI